MYNFPCRTPIRGQFPELPRGAVREWRKCHAVHSGKALEVIFAGKHQRIALETPHQIQRIAFIRYVIEMPAFLLAVEEHVCTAISADRTVPVFNKKAAAQNGLDATFSSFCAVEARHVERADPEIKLPLLTGIA